MAYKNMSIPIDASAFGTRDYTTVWWLAGGGFLINTHGTIIMIDPVISTHPDNVKNCETSLALAVKYPINVEKTVRADAVLYTHTDDDHLGPISAPALADRLHPINIGPPPVFEKLVRMGVHHSEIISCRYGDTIKLGDANIEVIDADHPYQIVWGKLHAQRPFRTGDCCGYIIRTPDANILFTGDTRLMEFHLKLIDIDIITLDVSRDLSYHISTNGAVVLANTYEQSLVVPYHYGTFDNTDNSAFNGSPDDVLPMINNPERVRVLIPGQPLSMKGGKEIK